jgi:hypothetical protein
MRIRWYQQSVQGVSPRPRLNQRLPAVATAATTVPAISHPRPSAAHCRTPDAASATPALRDVTAGVDPDPVGEQERYRFPERAPAADLRDDEAFLQRVQCVDVRTPIPGFEPRDRGDHDVRRRRSRDVFRRRVEQRLGRYPLGGQVGGIESGLDFGRRRTVGRGW